MRYRLGLIGHPVQHSLSPLMHNAALNYFGFDGSYELIDVEDDKLPLRVGSLFQDGFSGVNVTVPYKEKVLHLLNELTDEAKLVQAVNTIAINSAGKLLGHNTDMAGFAAALVNKLNLRDRACLLGAGGSARSVAFALAKLGFKNIDIFARNIKAAEAIKKDLDDRLPADKCKMAVFSFSQCAGKRDYNLVVNCTSIGVVDTNFEPWMEEVFGRIVADGLFFDLVYGRNSTDTLMVKKAKSMGIKSCDGREMLIQQAIASFKFWTQAEAPFKVLSEAIEKD